MSYYSISSLANERVTVCVMSFKTGDTVHKYIVLLNFYRGLENVTRESSGFPVSAGVNKRKVRRNFLDKPLETEQLYLFY